MVGFEFSASRPFPSRLAEAHPPYFSMLWSPALSPRPCWPSGEGRSSLRPLDYQLFAEPRSAWSRGSAWASHQILFAPAEGSPPAFLPSRPLPWPRHRTPPDLALHLAGWEP